MTEPYSEADARRELIDRNLNLAGWNVDDPSQVVRELDIYVSGGTVGAVRERAREEYAGHQFAEYALQSDMADALTASLSESLLHERSA